MFWATKLTPITKITIITGAKHNKISSVPNNIRSPLDACRLKCGNKCVDILFGHRLGDANQKIVIVAGVVLRQC